MRRCKFPCFAGAPSLNLFSVSRRRGALPVLVQIPSVLAPRGACCRSRSAFVLRERILDSKLHFASKLSTTVGPFLVIAVVFSRCPVFLRPLAPYSCLRWAVFVFWQGFEWDAGNEEVALRQVSPSSPSPACAWIKEDYYYYSRSVRFVRVFLSLPTAVLYLGADAGLPRLCRSRPERHHSSLRRRFWLVSTNRGLLLGCVVVHVCG